MRVLLTALIIFLFCGLAILGVRSVGSDSFGKDVALFYDFVFTPTSKIKLINGRSNVLILGKGGVGHDAPDLTDTMIMASFNIKKHEITLITLPRDIWIDDLKAKLNSVYYWGSQKEPNGGLVLTKSVVEEITGQPVQYAMVVDFTGFKKIVDDLGGVDVNVKAGFTDNQDPIAGRENDDCGGDPDLKCRYETVTFKAGMQHMDGDTALKFVRSRHASGNEGTDFARSARAEELLVAIKDKILSKELILHPLRIVKLIAIANSYIETDLKPDNEAILARKLIQSRNSISSHVLADNYLTNPPQDPKYDNLYVLVPKSGNWDEVHAWVNCLLVGGVCN